MNCVIYSVLAIFWLTYGSTVGNSDFFESSSQSENDWDPARDFFGEYNMEEKDSPQYSSDNSQLETKDKATRRYSKREDLQYRAYLVRFINIFLRSTGFWDDAFGDESKTLRVYLTLSKEDFNILKNFGSNDEISLETLENSFRSMFNSKHDFHTGTALEYSVVMEYLKYAILIALLLAIVIFIVIMIRKINFKTPAISLMLFIAYISIVLHGLLKQYEDISENIVIRRLEFDNFGTPPKECLYSKMTYLEKIYVHLFKDDSCQRFLQSRKSVWYEMDLVSAFIKPFQSIFSTLCSILGEGSEKMIKPFIDRSPWPINIILEFLVTIMQLPLLFFALFLIFFTLTSRSISLKIPFVLSMTTEKKPDINNDHSSKKLKDYKLSSSESSIKTYVVNQGGIILLGNEDKQFQSYSIQGSSSLNFNSQSNSFKISQQTNESFMKETGYLEDMKSGSIIDKQFAINKKEVRREHKKLTYFKKMNFKPNKRIVNLKATKENLDILPLS